eukprot:5541226-Pleurochrysis_carterae.AAC.1
MEEGYSVRNARRRKNTRVPTLGRRSSHAVAVTQGHRALCGVVARQDCTVKPQSWILIFVLERSHACIASKLKRDRAEIRQGSERNMKISIRDETMGRGSMRRSLSHEAFAPRDDLFRHVRAKPTVLRATGLLQKAMSSRSHMSV